MPGLRICTHLILLALSLICIPATCVRFSISPTVKLAPSNHTGFNSTLARAQNTARATLHHHSSISWNETLATESDFIQWKVRGTDISLEFHTFGAVIPNDEVLYTLTPAAQIVLRYCISGQGHRPIAKGFFRYVHEFVNKDLVTFSVADFREIGLPMSYFMLADVLKGIIDFMRQPKRNWTEVSFEVTYEKLGYVGSGYMERAPAPTSTSGIS